MSKERELLKEYRMAVRDDDYTNADKAYDILYPKPKDVLFEKFKEYHAWILGYQESDDTYSEINVFTKFKETFKDELNGLQGLYELEKSLLDRLTDGQEKVYVQDVISIISKIKERTLT